MTDHNDMEDPQSGEILPPMLYDVWWELSMEFQSSSSVYQDEEWVRLLSSNLRLIKFGMALAYQDIKPLMQAALPYFEDGVRDTRIKQADADLVRVLAEFKEVATYIRKDVEAE